MIQQYFYVFGHKISKKQLDMRAICKFPISGIINVTAELRKNLGQLSVQFYKQTIKQNYFVTKFYRGFIFLILSLELLNA